MRIGIDLGGTKTEVIALADDSTTLFRQRAATPRHDYQQTIELIARLVDNAESATGQRGSVGIGIPGTLSRNGRVKNANSTWLNGQPFDQHLSERLQREIRIANDANCLAVSEAVDGAAAGEAVVFAVIIGTGCGAGIALAGHCHAGHNGTAGEWGHNPLPWLTDDERQQAAHTPCYCGKSACIETFISGTGFTHDYNYQQQAHLITGNRGLPVTGEGIVRLAAQGDLLARQTLQRYQQRLARALASVINTLDPDVIVLGGGMSNVESLYQQVPKLLPQWVFGGECDTPLRKALHGDSSGVRGAAWLWSSGS